MNFGHLIFHGWLRMVKIVLTLFSFDIKWINGWSMVFTDFPFVHPEKTWMMRGLSVSIM